MSKPKGRVMNVSELRTGDSLMQPTVRNNSIVTHVQTFDSAHFVSLANGATVEIPRNAKVRVHRRVKTVNHDAPAVVFSSGG